MGVSDTRSPVVRQRVSLLALLALLIAAPALANASDGIKGRKCQRDDDAALREDTAERALLAKHAAFIKRAGDTLELRAGNRVLKFEDICDELREDERVLYRFVDYFGDLDHVLIEENYYEGRGYSLIGMKLGTKQKIDAVPLFSPDRVHFLTVDICDAHCPTRYGDVTGSIGLRWSGPSNHMSIGLKRAENGSMTGRSR